MPFYEYKCEKCQEVVTLRHSMNDDTIKYHHECNGILKKIISISTFVFKGSGFYETDYKNRKQK